ncbi:MAG: hypothetical protein M9900_01125 [Flavobacteriales bacterium]|nr:hypothetical protein [Flavobacteriales bacterium]
MNLPLRHSITELVRVWDTNINPVQVIADDVKDYVAKHNRGQAPCTRLRNEVLAHAYAGIWGLPVLEAALLKVDPLHVGRHLSGTCQPAYFKHTCFATRFRKDSTEFNRFLDQANAYEGKRFVNRQDLLKIALFDIWLANDDRTGNHPNLLVTADGEGFTIRVMDHEGIFYGNNPERPLPHLTLEDSILTHPALRNLLGRNFKRNTNLVQQAVGNFYLWASACEQRTDEILSLLPADWRIDVATFRPLVQQRLFAQDRLRAVEHHFHELLQQC